VGAKIHYFYQNAKIRNDNFHHEVKMTEKMEQGGMSFMVLIAITLHLPV
jgi:hypothetical protein